MTSSRRTPVTLMLLGLVAALGYVNWKLAGADIDISPIAAETPAETATHPAVRAPATESAPRPLTAFRETLTRPLFHATRRPLVIRQAAAPPSEVKVEPQSAPVIVEPSKLKLVGVMRTGSKTQRALIRPEGQSYGTWVDVGGEIQGWRLARIEDNRVVVEKSGGTEELLLHSPGR